LIDYITRLLNFYQEIIVEFTKFTLKHVCVHDWVFPKKFNSIQWLHVDGVNKSTDNLWRSYQATKNFFKILNLQTV